MSLFTRAKARHEPDFDQWRGRQCFSVSGIDFALCPPTCVQLTFPICSRPVTAIGHATQNLHLSGKI
ncbi:hypothetical protein QFZ34_001140 [Phyllobacterium ifriqiyense]|uniref:Uncharacterized protein n=1 Tax=Phyllobacterium ifriqiyense TaxID=314238 RepID=A0ABU0S8B1_9HYPH|nr:hypothetical protein [Phyllobacterium ifriqiyense]